MSLEDLARATARVSRRRLLLTGAAGGAALLLSPLLGGKIAKGQSGIQCPACGNCVRVTIDPSSGDYTTSQCSNSCESSSLCTTANADPNVSKVLAGLASRGFAQSTQETPGSVEVYSGTSLVGRSLVVAFDNSSDRTVRAVLVYGGKAGQSAVAWAFVFSRTQLMYGLAVGGGGAVVSASAPTVKITDAAVSPHNYSYTRGAERIDLVSSVRPSVVINQCSILSDLGCGLTLGLVSFGLTALICAGTAGIACGLVIGWEMLGTMSAVACTTFGAYICAPDFVQCSCTGYCYDSSQESLCLEECPASLACFTGICGPQSDATKCRGFSV